MTNYEMSTAIAGSEMADISQCRPQPPLADKMDYLLTDTDILVHIL